MKRSLYIPHCLLLIAVLALPCDTDAQQAKNITLQQELQFLHNIAQLPLYNTNTYSAQVSTYDTTGGNNDGFNGDYSFIRKTADSSLVIFDVQGCGVVNRIWTPTPTEDTLDFYIDDTSKPVLSIYYKDLFSGTVFPFVQPLCGSQLGGNYCYFPILFQQRCIIIARAKRMQFHQVQYRLFPQGTQVKNFTPMLNDEEKLALQKIKNVWTNPQPAAIVKETKTLELSAALQPGETKDILNLTQGGRITSIELSPSAVFEGLTKQVDLLVYWDDEKEPAINCPIADFFGYAFGKRSMRGLLIGSNTEAAYCYLPMPFDKKARIALRYRMADNLTAKTVQIHAKINYTLQQRNPGIEGRLYTYWNKQQPQKGSPHVFLQTSDKGHFVGAILQAQGLQNGMTIFFEGDDSTVIDGQMRLHGTGSEDYFNGGWYAFMDCWDARMSLPLHGSLDYSLPYCRTGGYRFYMGDKLSFEKNFYHSIEHGPENNAFPSEYTSVSFYYGSHAPQGSTKPLTVSTAVYVPDTLNLYPQLLEFTVWDAADVKATWAYPTGGQSFIFGVNSESKLRLSLKDILPGKYKLYADYELNSEGCDFSIWQRQTQLSEWISTSAGTKSRNSNHYLCDITTDDLVNALTLRFKNTGQKKSFFLNRFILVKQ
ncbi:glycoside hydrolase family 172 protein [Foetidibacter luteolus]|uniref:glycoside hydrolase family 172 protein n=1 Tax=Foetidibacter luteolus TaxID=2608880 RepID=UPI00129B7958|nr:glycoside hydrolase family 172 protein [Foetidibacter luteolus]